MITRYNADFESRMIEPDTEGKWVKYKDHEQLEMLVDVRVEETVQEKMREQLAELQSKSEQVVALTDANVRLDGELNELKASTERVIGHQDKLIQAAKARLKLLGHAPTCDSRYGTITVEGRAQANECQLHPP